MSSSFPRFIKAIVYRFLKWFVSKEFLTAPKNMKAINSVYDIPLTTINGQKTSLEQFRGKKILIVNTASACGYTPQYKQLQELHEMMSDKIIVLGFPCNDFGEQEQGSEKEILTFCEVNYGVTFPLFQKLHVKGNEIHPLYKWLTDAKSNGWNTQEPTWNFCKYLIGEDGDLLNFFSATVDPFDAKIIG